ncbi:JmjC domain-containing protein 4 [Glycine soja]
MELIGKELSYSEFVERYMEKNQPVVLTGLMGLMDPLHWRASTDWVTHNSQPNFQFFSTHFGASKVQHTSLQCSLLMTGSTLYLDNFRDSSDAHQPNEEICCSDYQFVFMGVKGVIIGFINSSSRAMHIRLFCTSLYREMKNPPVTSFFQLFWQDLGLLFMLMFLGPIASKQMNMKNCVYNIFDEVSNSKFPGFRKLVCMCVLAIWLECTEDAGEIIFVPSGWYHQFHNLEDTISINHNWFNAYNLSWVSKI